LPCRWEARRLHAAPRNRENQLVGRDISFGLGKLFASGPVDPWDIPPGQQLLLIQRYRELATREIRMGRHRRAAYIFASYWGTSKGPPTRSNWDSITAKRRFLYRERLKRPLDAVPMSGTRRSVGRSRRTLHRTRNDGAKRRTCIIAWNVPMRPNACCGIGPCKLTHSGHHIRASAVFHEKTEGFDEALIYA